MTDTLVQEISEDLRREKLERLWRRHGRALLLASALMLAVTVAYTVWQDRRLAALEEATSRVVMILQQLGADNRAEIAGKLTALTTGVPAGQAMLANLYAVGAALEAGEDRAKVAERLAALADQHGIPDPYRDLARLLSIQLRLDSGDPALLQNELSPLKDDGKPWRYSAREWSALLSIKQGDPGTARAGLEKLQADTEAPASVRERASRLLTVLPAS